MDAIVNQARTVQGSVRVPPDKAILQRAVLIAALARGETELAPWSSADDCQRALQVIRQLGVSAEVSGEVVHIKGRSPQDLSPASKELFFGESGTTFRLCAGILAGHPFRSILSGGPSLCRRPMRRVAEPLSRMGARVEGRRGLGVELYPPLTIEGHRPLRAMTYQPPVASAQVKSAVLLAGLSAQGTTTVVEPVPTRDHTERLLRRFHAVVRQRGSAVSVEGGRSLESPGRLTIPGDFSSAAFFLVAAACLPGSVLEIQGVGLNPTRTAVLRVLERMGASVQAERLEDAWEPRGTVRLTAQPLRGTTVEPQEVPGMIDELPLVMVAACCARGTTHLRGLAELRVKETDRIRSMTQGLARLGAKVGFAGADSLRITGTSLHGATVESTGDHRTAMALAIAGLAAEGATRITGAECVQKSFPAFFDLLRTLAPAS